MLFRSPGKFVAPASHLDIFSTAAAAGGAKVPTDRVIDGVDLLPFLRGEAQGRPHRILHWRTDRYFAIRDGDLKMQIADRPEKTWLYDLANDPLEHENLASRRPADVAALRMELERFDRAQVKPLWKSLGAGYIPIDKTLAAPQQSGDEYVYFSN